MNAKLVKTEYGFYQYDPIPSQKELQDFYENKYYQESHGSYELEYDDQERDFYKLKANLMLMQCRGLMSLKGMSFLDVGCGEGWLLDVFHKERVNVKGLDFSDFGVQKFHSHLLPFVVKCDIFDYLNGNSDEKFDVISLVNVIEHVRDPILLVDLIKSRLNKDGLLIVVAPNDFSALHFYLLDKKVIDEPFWLAYPEHLSYFNKETMTYMLEQNGMDVITVVADNAIDMNLLNSNSHYVKDRSLGKETHRFRIQTDNFLASIDLDKLLDLYTVYGQMGVGRDLSYFCKVKQ